jgi:acetylornithine deacetylase/succinyl-diaminopimelate desuccinylase-like protein
MRFGLYATVLALAVLGSPAPSQQAALNWTSQQAEILRHFRALVQIDTSNPPGNEVRIVEYLEKVLASDGIPSERFALDPNRPNLVARLKGNDAKRPVLMLAHTDVVGVQRDKWPVDPFGAVLRDGYVWGRGTTDDKDNLAASLMTLLLIKRSGAALDRDVIFLAESGEEGAPEFGAQFMIDSHFDAIDAEYCFAEGGGVVRNGGQARQANIGTTEKEPRPIEVIARGSAGHGSVPRTDNAVVRLSDALAKIAAWVPPLQISETTVAYFRTLSTLVSPEAAARYRDVLNPDPKVSGPAAHWLLENEPQHWSMLHTSLVPTVIEGGYRYNVIPSEAKAIVDVRLHPEEDQKTFLDRVRAVVNDPRVEVRWYRDPYRPAGASRLNTEAYSVLQAQLKAHYNTTALPTMGTGATDMSQVRSKGVQCYGIGPAVDVEDAGKGFGAHSDQERILESELHRFVRFQYDVVTELARAK